MFTAGVRDVRRLSGRCRVCAASLVLLALSGCGAIGQPAPYDSQGVDRLVIPTPTPDPDDFVDAIDNPWLPLTPGSTWRYEVQAGGDLIETIEVTVTNDTRDVAGVRATVVHDVVTDASGNVIEDTYDWFAQDAEGNVWYFGEDTTAFEDGQSSTAGSWEAGVDGAQAGLVMAAKPRVGDGYQQEYLAGQAEDQAQVLSLDATRTTSYRAFAELVETLDTTPLEPDVEEHKFYARDVGLVLEENETDDEVTELVDFAAG